MPKPYSMTIRISPDLLEEMRKLVLRKKRLDWGFSLNQWVTHAIMEKLEREKEQAK